MIIGKLKHGIEHWNYGVMVQRSFLNRRRIEMAIFLFKNGKDSRITQDIKKGFTLSLTVAI